MMVSKVLDPAEQQLVLMMEQFFQVQHPHMLANMQNQVAHPPNHQTVAPPLINSAVVQGSRTAANLQVAGGQVGMIAGGATAPGASWDTLQKQAAEHDAMVSHHKLQQANEAAMRASQERDRLAALHQQQLQAPAVASSSCLLSTDGIRFRVTILFA